MNSAALGFVSIVNPQGHTELVRYDQFVAQLMKPDIERMEAAHIGLGVSGEAGELADAIKREYVYGKPRNLHNIVEELGDLRWYIQACMNHYDINEQDILQQNANKLSVRYVGLKYTDEAAITRADKPTREDKNEIPPQAPV